MNKKDYEIAEMEIERFALEDIICASAIDDDGNGEDGQYEDP